MEVKNNNKHSKALHKQPHKAQHNEEFKQPIEIKISIEDSKKYFKASDDNTQAKLRFTDVALYSTTPYEQAIYTANILLSYYTPEELKEKTITDASACIGGNTWAFAEKAKHCNAIEISKLHADILTDNMKWLGYNNITTYQKNYIAIANELKQDILFLDPPWGGVNYRNEPNLTYQYNDKQTTLSQLLNGYLSYSCELVLLKIPTNTSEQLLEELKASNFLYYDELVISTTDDRPIYKLVVLSHVKKIRDLPREKFARLGYKGIKYTRVAPFNPL
jgi:predicted RNA methylase